MSVGITRASIFAIKEEVTAGELLAPSSAGQFVPLKDGFEMNYQMKKS
jgi:hypothetical protein